MFRKAFGMLLLAIVALAQRLAGAATVSAAHWLDKRETIGSVLSGPSEGMRLSPYACRLERNPRVHKKRMGGTLMGRRRTGPAFRPAAP